MAHGSIHRPRPIFPAPEQPPARAVAAWIAAGLFGSVPVLSTPTEADITDTTVTVGCTVVSEGD